MANAVATEPRRRKVRWQGLALVAGSICLVTLAVWMLVAPHTQSRAGQDALTRSQAAFEEATGVRLRWVAVTAGSGMLDLRYQVLEPDKALIVHDQKRPPRIIDEATGRILSRPWMDHAHKQELRTAITYHRLLVNSGGTVRRGSLVTVVIGEARLEHVVVQ